MYYKKIDELVKDLNTDLLHGLSRHESEKRLEEYGENRLQEGKQRSFYTLLLMQFQSVLIIILIAAAIISMVVGDITEGIVILLIVILNAFIGAKQEKSAGDAVKALREMSSPSTRVIIDGNIIEMNSTSLVPGDVVLLEAGNLVSADIRLVESVNMQVEESALTGESVPVEKNANSILKEDTPLSERENMVYMGTIVTYGRGKGVVTATGMSTEMGKIAKMLETDNEPTPLQQKLESLGKTLGYACLGVCVLVFLLGFIRRMDLLFVFMTAISLAVAAVPEGLPAIVTVVLSIGMKRLVKKHVLTKNLSSVETLGSTTVICSDKTGTLTQNKMNVKKVYNFAAEIDVTGNGYSKEGSIGKNFDVANIERLLQIAVLCNDSEIKNDESGVIGDPTEGALLVLGAKGGYHYEALRESYKRLSEFPFDSDRKMMSTLHKIDEKCMMLVKGSPDSVVSRCSKVLINGKEENIDNYKDDIKRINDEWSDEALRVLAYAYKEVGENVSLKDEEHSMILAGLTGMIDPPREEAKLAIRKCKSAGIRVVMITGDNAITASAIGRQIGLLERGAKAVTGSEIDKMTDSEFEDKIELVNVFSRVSPHHKVRIVDALKAKGEIVAMTGDGVNDAPSLKRADIGIAMGITGTDVSKEAADMILTDDNFVSIVGAVEEGRVIYANIRKFVSFLVSCNIGEIILIFVSMLFGFGVPLTPIQLLYVNLITDSLPAFALGLEGKEDNVMKKPPRDPDEKIVDKIMLKNITVQSIALAVATLFSYMYGNHISSGHGMTFAFITLISGELLRAYSGRSEVQPVHRMGFFGNKYMNCAVIGSYVLTIFVIIVPFFRDIFDIERLTIAQYLTAFAFSVIPFGIAEISKMTK